MHKKSDMVIPSGATYPVAGMQLDGRSVLRLSFPTMTGTSATLQISEDGGTTWKTLGDQSDAITILAPSGRSVQLNPELTIGVELFRVVSSGAEASGRTIQVTTETYTR